LFDVQITRTRTIFPLSMNGSAFLPVEKGHDTLRALPKRCGFSVRSPSAKMLSSQGADMKTYQITLPDEFAKFVDETLAKGAWDDLDHMMMYGLMRIQDDLQVAGRDRP